MFNDKGSGLGKTTNPDVPLSINSDMNAVLEINVDKEILSSQWAIHNPLNPKAWLLLAQSESDNNIAQSRQSLNQAMQLSQNRTQILNDIYLEYLFKGDIDSALKTATRIVTNRSELFDNYFFDLYSLVDAEVLFSNFLMKIEESRSNEYLVWDKALNLAIEFGNDSLIEQILSFLPANHLPQENIIGNYLHKLSNDQSWSKIKPIWSKYANYQPVLNQVSDPRFERFPDPIDTCWSSQPHSHVDVTAEGGSGLRVEFDGSSNTSFYHVSCLVAVEPNSSYDLSWRWYGQNVTTRSGFFIEVTKPTNSQSTKLNSSKNGYGSWPWQSEFMEFETDQDTQLVKITMRRKPTSNLDNKISGTVLINDLALTKTNPS